MARCVSNRRFGGEAGNKTRFGDKRITDSDRVFGVFRRRFDKKGLIRFGGGFEEAGGN